MRSFHRKPAIILSLAAAAALSWGAASDPGTRVLLDAHNCYPYDGQWADRIDRALATGIPVAIEQDLYWYKDPATGKAWSVVSHDKPTTGKEPTMRDYFFEKIRPIVEREMVGSRRDQWPLIVLNLDFKTNEPEHHAAIWKLLGEYEGWLTTAVRGVNIDVKSPLTIRPVLVLTGEPASQEVAFHDKVKVGDRLRVFGAAAVTPKSTCETPPASMVPAGANNYRRWWNNPWAVVECGGQRKAGDWTPVDAARLNALTAYAHKKGYWMRFYTLNGFTSPEEEKAAGASPIYNFGSPEAAMLRWKAAIAAGVDFIATDLYEDFSRFKAAKP